MSREDFESMRESMVDGLARRGRIQGEGTIEALRSVPRHEFVPESRRRDAYTDRPLPIGDDQTISAPHMVGIMTDLLDLAPGDEVLEVGTGRGYHAAVTAEIVGDGNVYTVEYGEELAELARENLEETGYGDVSVRVGDGREGWPEHAPFDAIYLTAAAEGFPRPLIEQLREGGTILAPIGTRFQELVLGEKRPDGSLDRERHGGVRFVTIRG